MLEVRHDNQRDTRSAITTASKAAPLAEPRSSPARIRSAPDSRRRGCREQTVGLRAEDPTIAELLSPLGYATGQFGKNHLGDKDEFLPTVHGFDEFFGNLYHLNAEKEPEDPDYRKNPGIQKTVRTQERAPFLGGWKGRADD